jgi:hypothetical protein
MTMTTASKTKSPKSPKAEKAKLTFTTVLDPPASVTLEGIKGKSTIAKIESGKGRAPAFLIGVDKDGGAVRFQVQSRAKGLEAINYIVDSPFHAVPAGKAAKAAA